jgi:SAM-dependent methyltransferase
MSTLITKEDRINIAHIFTDKYYELVNLSKKYVLYLIIDTFKKSNIHLLIKSEFVSVEKIIQDLNFIPKAKIPILWMLSYLKELGFLAIKQADNISYFKISKDFPDINPDTVIDRMLKIDKNVLPSNLLLERAAKGYLDFFQGNKTAVDILFTTDKMKLWVEYFSNNNSGYVVYNSFATLGLLKWLLNREGIKILEVGGGTGSASVFFLKEIYNKSLIRKIDEYIFSDISPILLRVGNRAIMEELPDIQMVQLKTLDFNKSFFSQGIKPNSFDVVFGVNSIHAAEDLVSSLENIYYSLKPGGLIILSECVRPKENGLLFQELIFNLLDNYRDIKLSALRPMPGFLDVKSWKRILKKTKFKNIELLTNIDSDNKRNSFYDKQVFAMILKGEK